MIKYSGNSNYQEILVLYLSAQYLREIFLIGLRMIMKEFREHVSMRDFPIYQGHWLDFILLEEIDHLTNLYYFAHRVQEYLRKINFQYL